MVRAEFSRCAKRKANIVFSSEHTQIYHCELFPLFFALFITIIFIVRLSFSARLFFCVLFCFCSHRVWLCVVLLAVLPFLRHCFLLLYFSSLLCRSQAIVVYHSSPLARIQSLAFWSLVRVYSAKQTNAHICSILLDTESKRRLLVFFVLSSARATKKDRPAKKVSTPFKCTRFVLFGRRRLSFFGHNSKLLISHCWCGHLEFMKNLFWELLTVAAAVAPANVIAKNAQHEKRVFWLLQNQTRLQPNENETEKSQQKNKRINKTVTV